MTIHRYFRRSYSLILNTFLVVIIAGPVVNAAENLSELDRGDGWLWSSSLVLPLMIGLVLLGLYALWLNWRMLSLKKRIWEYERSETNSLIKSEKADLEGNRAKDAFMAHVSHVLRTPLNVVIGYSELLAEVCSEKGLTEILPDIDKIHLSGQQLLENINNMLQLTQAEAGKMRVLYDVFRTRDFVDEVLKTMTPAMKKSSNRFSLNYENPPEYVELDLAKIRQILIHLLSNAIKYTDKGEIQLRLHATHLDGRDWLEMEVIDTGKGIPKTLLNDLFKGFTERGQLGRPENAGTGLGLAICKSLCRMMGGDIYAESEWGKGSRFSVRLPAAPMGGGQMNPGSVKAGGDILVICDDVAKNDILVSSLSVEGVSVQSINPGRGHLKQIAKNPPNVIVVDGMMSGLNGLATLKSIESKPSLRDTPMVMTTMMDDVSMTYTLGVIGYMLKPVKEAHLLSVLSHILPDNPNEPVMIVEDDRITRRMMGQALERAGWNVEEAGSGQVALERMAQFKPALVLLDLMMPEMSGYDFFSKIRSKKEWQDIPVVFVSAGNVSGESRLRIGGPFTFINNNGDYRDDDFLRRLQQQVMLYMSHEKQQKEAAKHG